MATNLGDLLKNLGLEESDTPDTSNPGTPDEPVLGFAKKVVVRINKRGRGGKTITELQGVETDREGFAKRLRKKLGVGTKVEGELLIVQGDQRDRLVALLSEAGAKNVVRS